MSQSIQSNSNALIRMKIKERADNPTYIEPAQKSDNFSGVNLISEEEDKFKYGWKYMPIKKKYQFRCGADAALVDITPLLQYPTFQHHLNIFPNNSSNPPKYVMIVDFVQLRSNVVGSEIKMTVKSAHLLRDTDTFGEMEPYLVIKNQATKFKYKTKQPKKGKDPIFQQQLKIPIKTIEDSIIIQLWDEDQINDDFIAGTIVKAYNLFNASTKQFQDFNLLYNEKSKSDLNGGTIKIKVQTPQFININ